MRKQRTSLSRDGSCFKEISPVSQVSCIPVIYREYEHHLKGFVAIIQYLTTTYLPVVDQFAAFATKLHRNYGVRATSRAEGSHSNLKRHLKNRNGSLDDLNIAVSRVREWQQKKFDQEREKQRHRVLPNHNQPLYQLVRCRVSFDCL